MLSRGFSLAALGVGLLGALGSLGCEDDGETSSGAAGGAGGSSTGGNASVGGSSSTGGNTATGGAAQQEATHDELLAAAVVIGSCWPDDGINRNLARLVTPESFPTSGTFELLPLAHCIATAGGGCHALTTCTGYLPSTYEGTATSECDGSVIHSREDGYELTFDCASLGLECDPELACVRPGATPCDRATFTSRCDNGVPVACDDGFEVVGRPCSELGLTCNDGRCEGAGAACTGGTGYNDADLDFEGLGCSGNVLDACINFKETSLDCASVGPDYGCQEFEGTFFCGLGSECLPGEVPHGVGSAISCEGTEVVFCEAGLVRRLDCTTLGFTGCTFEPGDRQGGCTPTFPL